VSKARAYADKNALDLSIQVDGGVTLANIADLAAAGADTFVAGTAVFEAADRNKRIEELRALAITL
jgi:ribulose-phosphate 3-epimerase